MAYSAKRILGCHLPITLLALLTAMCSCGRNDADQSEPSTVSELTFGHRQVAQMLKDRPRMRDILKENDPVRKWIVDSFNGARTGHRIYWNADAPRSGQGAEHAPRYYHYPAQIYITGGTEETPVDKWAAVVYELFNLENSSDFEKLRNRALAGEIDGNYFATECVKLEFRATKKAEGFFRENPLPSAADGRDEWYAWLRSGVGTYEEYAEKWKGYAGPGNYKHFLEEYETNIRPWSQRSESESPWSTALSNWVDQMRNLDSDTRSDRDSNAGVTSD